MHQLAQVQDSLETAQKVSGSLLPEWLSRMSESPENILFQSFQPRFS